MAWGHVYFPALIAPANETTLPQVLGKDVDRGIDILSDILLNSNLDERAINRERDVILREMEEVGTGSRRVCRITA